VPQQALALANGKLSLAMSREIAGQLSRAAPSGDKFADSVFERILGRPATPVERRESINYLQEQTEFYRDPSKLTPFQSGPEANVKPAKDASQRARESLVHVLLNHNDFVTIR
jgi:hypothetical protein